MDIKLRKSEQPALREGKTGWPWDVEVDESVYEKSISWPKISVVVPSYNQDIFLEETLRSIVSQNYPNIEILVMDGGSTDGSVNIIRHYEAKLTKWVSEKDKGQSNALNKGLQLCTGDYLGWQNSDDIYYAGALKKLAEGTLSGHDVVYSSVDAIDSESKFMYRLYWSPFWLFVLKYKAIVFGNHTALFRTSLMKEIKFEEDLHYVMDLELLFQLAEHKATFKMIRGIWGGYRFHAGAKTVTEWAGKSQKESLLVRKQHGVNVDLNKSFDKQFIFQKLICYGYIAFWKVMYGGFFYKLKQYIKPDRDPLS